jgi:hypothetical protein
MSAVAERLQTITSKTGVGESDVAEMLGTTTQTLYRWRKSQADPRSSHLRRILDLAFAVEELSEVYEPDATRVWLYSRNKLLGGERPVDMISRGEIDPVLQAIALLRDGAYA